MSLAHVRVQRVLPEAHDSETSHWGADGAVCESERDNPAIS